MKEKVSWIQKSAGRVLGEDLNGEMEGENNVIIFYLKNKRKIMQTMDIIQSSSIFLVMHIHTSFCLCG